MDRFNRTGPFVAFIPFCVCDPRTLVFSNRPDRVTGHLPSEVFLASWEEGHDSFASNPPNAVLSIFTEDEVHDVVVVLQDPVLEGSYLDELERLAGLRDQGIITDEEFEAKKGQLLGL